MNLKQFKRPYTKIVVFMLSIFMSFTVINIKPSISATVDPHIKEYVVYIKQIDTKQKAITVKIKGKTRRLFYHLSTLNIKDYKGDTISLTKLLQKLPLTAKITVYDKLYQEEKITPFIISITEIKL